MAFFAHCFVVYRLFGKEGNGNRVVGLTGFGMCRRPDGFFCFQIWIIDLRFDHEGSLRHPDGPSLIFKKAPIPNHLLVDHNSEFNGFPLSTERAGDVGGLRRGSDQYGSHDHGQEHE